MHHRAVGDHVGDRAATPDDSQPLLRAGRHPDGRRFLKGFASSPSADNAVLRSPTPIQHLNQRSSLAPLTEDREDLARLDGKRESRDQDALPPDGPLSHDQVHNVQACSGHFSPARLLPPL
ncbi:hypothetical protein GCM10007231_19940 [Nocardioides daphniae]|uniref:Uncharacterized protein n=1 Tax=Nocardioides daphniae TaxID=402297 RepID=A0ABQ1QBT1_9ACTN|nr:hypothetical protein GCM10007231_19940 [Nocardioides daphniae]